MLDGIKQPWLFQYTFSDLKVYEAVHNIENTYQPSSLKYVEILYIVGPLYLCLIYVVNATFIIVGASFKNHQILYVAGYVSLGMNSSVVALTTIYGFILHNLVDDYLLKCINQYKISQKDLDKEESVAKVIITSYVVTSAIILMSASAINYFGVAKLTRLMKYYMEQNIEHETFIPLPSFLGGNNFNTQIGDDLEITRTSNTIKYK